MNPLLIITNGESAVFAMEEARIAGDKLSWDDVLHDGPVPAGLELDEMSDVRAHFIASWAWGDPERVRRDFADRDATLETASARDEVVLWFEHDLYDQLQLFQLLDWFSHWEPGDTRLTLIQDSEFISETPPERLPARFEDRPRVTEAQLALGHLAWAAFTAPEPDALRRLLDIDTDALPYLRPAVERLLEEYPDEVTGLARSERQILEALEGGATSPGLLFRAVSLMEEARYLGDLSFLRYLERLSEGAEPLVQLSEGGPFRLSAPAPGHAGPPTLPGPVELTETGRQVLAGERNWIQIAGVDRWIGGVHLAEAGRVRDRPG